MTAEPKKKRRSTSWGIIKDLQGQTTGYVYIYPTSPPKDTDENVESQGVGKSEKSGAEV